MNIEKPVSSLSTIELKALAYDQLVQIELAQNNLKTINQELVVRSKQNVVSAVQQTNVDQKGSIQSL
jgi:hypothetical protein